VKPKTQAAADAWRAAIDELDAANNAEGDTIEQIAARWGKTHEWTRSQVLRLVAAGKAEHVGFKKRGSAKLKVYRLIEGRAKGKK
jgi:predicted YcjX-like family ATPase